MPSFKLYDKKIVVPMSLSNYNVFRDRYLNFACVARKEFSKKYKQKFHYIEDLLNDFHEVCKEVLDTVAQKAVNDLLRIKVLDATIDMIYEGLAKVNGGRMNLDIAYAEIEDKYFDIVTDQEMAAEDREERRENRSRWVGGGFGMQGAMKGAMEAGMLNAASGIAYGAANMVGNAFSAIGAEIKKSELFDNPSTFKTVDQAFYQDCKNILLVIINILKENGKEIKSITDDEIKKADVLLNNVSNPNFPKDEVLPSLIKIILLNPYQDKTYRYMIDVFGDKDNDVETLANFFHIDITGHKVKKVEDYFEELPLDTLDDVLNAREKMSEKCVYLGGVPKPISEKLDKLLDDKKYEKIYTEYNNTTKTSIDDWVSCRKKVELMSQELDVSDNGERILTEIDTEITKYKCSMAKSFLSTQSVANEDDAAETKKKLEEYCNQIGLSLDNPVMYELTDIIKKIDIGIRTVEGYEFDSKEKAQKALNEKKAICDMLGCDAPISKGDFQLLLQYLDNNKITPELDKIYRTKCKSALKTIQKNQKQARIYELRLSSSLHIVGGLQFILYAFIYFNIFIFGAIGGGGGCIISSIIILIWELIKRNNEKKAWRQLTDDGNNELSVVLADEPSKSHNCNYLVCSQCGHKLKAGDLFCVKCGTKSQIKE